MVENLGFYLKDRRINIYLLIKWFLCYLDSKKIIEFKFWDKLFFIYFIFRWKRGIVDEWEFWEVVSEGFVYNLWLVFLDFRMINIVNFYWNKSCFSLRVDCILVFIEVDNIKVIYGLC